MTKFGKLSLSLSLPKQANDENFKYQQKEKNIFLSLVIDANQHKCMYFCVWENFSTVLVNLNEKLFMVLDIQKFYKVAILKKKCYKQEMSHKSLKDKTNK